MERQDRRRNDQKLDELERLVRYIVGGLILLSFCSGIVGSVVMDKLKEINTMNSRLSSLEAKIELIINGKIKQ